MGKTRPPAPPRPPKGQNFCAAPAQRFAIWRKAAKASPKSPPIKSLTPLLDRIASCRPGDASTNLNTLRDGTLRLDAPRLGQALDETIDREATKGRQRPNQTATISLDGRLIQFVASACAIAAARPR